MKLTRRAFIQASAATGSWLAAGMPFANEPVTNAMAVRKAKAAGAPKGEWVSTACQGCTQWCAIQIFVQPGMIEVLSLHWGCASASCGLKLMTL